MAKVLGIAVDDHDTLATPDRHGHYFRAEARDAWVA